MYIHAQIRACINDVNIHSVRVSERACLLQLFTLKVIIIKYTLTIFLHLDYIANLVIGQNLGQSPCFREKYDVAVARAVAEMRVLGNK